MPCLRPRGFQVQVLEVQDASANPIGMTFPAMMPALARGLNCGCPRVGIQDREIEMEIIIFKIMFVSGFLLVVTGIIALCVVDHDKLFPWRWADVRRMRELNYKVFLIKDRQRYEGTMRASTLGLARELKTTTQDREHRKDAPVCRECDHFFEVEWNPVCLITPIGGADWVDGSRERATIPNARSAIAPCGPRGVLFTPFIEPDISKEMKEYDEQHGQADNR